MATEKQIRANRENAKRSTGPKTAAGRTKSGRNSFRHGLSLPSQPDPTRSAKFGAIAEMLVSDQANEIQVMVAIEVANAQLDLLRIRGVRNQMITELDQTACNLIQLRRLSALDRYERLALAKRRRALKVFGDNFVRTNPI